MNKEAKRRVLVMMEVNSCEHVAEANFWECPVIDDTGASYGLSPFRSDFMDYEEISLQVQDIAHVNEVIGIGTVLWKVQDRSGQDVYLPMLCYHMPTADI